MVLMMLQNSTDTILIIKINLKLVGWCRRINPAAHRLKSSGAGSRGLPFHTSRLGPYVLSSNFFVSSISILEIWVPTRQGRAVFNEIANGPCCPPPIKFSGNIIVRTQDVDIAGRHASYETIHSPVGNIAVVSGV